MKRKSGVLLAAAILLLGVTFIACKGREASTGGGGVAARTGPVDPSKLKVAVALGWMANESGWSLKAGHQDGLAAIGVPESNIAYFDANYDPVLQSQQIESIIESKPDILFLVPANADGLSEAVHHALEAGIPVFTTDGTVNGAQQDVTSQITNDNYGEGGAVMESLIKKINYKGNVCLIKLDPNPAWKPRSDAAYDVIKKYPDIKIVGEWSWDPTGVNTPRQAMDGFLAANPQRDGIQAVWCAWDTAAFEAIEGCRAAGRTEIIFGGHNGGVEACERIAEGTQFVASISPRFYAQGIWAVNNALAHLKGEKIEQTIYTPSAVLEYETLSKVQLQPGQDFNLVERPGVAEEWGITVVQKKP
ncbi:MAG: sugar ABC transporter substrate-binding protein [Treponema sp.]|jgi:ribose transport system substrate-binding protein|nr:sugar ABC transporter substrate-binding protein [Treponema sp.]